MFHSKIIVFSSIFISCLGITLCSHEIQKRFILFPESFVMQLTGGIAVPSNIPNRTFAINMCMQANFNAISNISQLTPTVIQARNFQNNKYYDIDRYTLYTYISNILESYTENADTCLLRTICEISDIPLNTNGLLERILQYILMPSNDSTNIVFNQEMMKYHEAETMGKLHENCSNIYSECEISLLNIISQNFVN